MCFFKYNLFRSLVRNVGNGSRSRWITALSLMINIWKEYLGFYINPWWICFDWAIHDMAEGTDGCRIGVVNPSIHWVNQDRTPTLIYSSWYIKISWMKSSDVVFALSYQITQYFFYVLCQKLLPWTANLKPFWNRRRGMRRYFRVYKDRQCMTNGIPFCDAVHKTVVCFY